jgi:hypothetical protein
VSGSFGVLGFRVVWAVFLDFGNLKSLRLFKAISGV